MTLIAAQWRLIKTSPTPRAPPTGARHWAAPRTPRRDHRRRIDVNQSSPSRPATNRPPPLEDGACQSTGTPLPSTRGPAHSRERAVPEAAIGRQRRHTASRPASLLGLARQRLGSGRRRRRELSQARPPVGWRRRPSSSPRLRSPPPPVAAPPARAAEVRERDSGGGRLEQPGTGRAGGRATHTAQQPSILRVTRAPRLPPAARAGEACSQRKPPEVPGAGSLLSRTRTPRTAEGGEGGKREWRQ